MEPASPEIIVVPNPETLARKTADIIYRRMQAILAASDHFSWVLAGGSTPKGLYALMAESPDYRDHIPWDRIHFFWGDDRHVPPDDAESNYRMAYESLLSKVPVPVENIHRIRTEMPDADQAAANYAGALGKFFKLPSDQLPRFDCVLLGMGPDGHTASLFPGTRALGETKKWVVANWVDKLKTFRITMCVPVLNNAAMVIFLISGPQKAAVLRDVLEGDFQPDHLPSQRIHPVNGKLLWLVDQPAAARLSRYRRKVSS